MIERPHASVLLPPTPLIGREAEIAQVGALLDRPGTRLITLTGTGGAGKTRLALAVLERTWSRFSGEVCFVDLAPLTDWTLVAPTIAGALGVRELPGEPQSPSLAAHLGDRPLLLLLDNFEHLLPAASLIGGLLARCPGLTVLVTSRIPLRLAEEQEFPVPPLALPAIGAPVTVASLGDAPATALFLERVRRRLPHFAPSEADARAIAEICRRLDGLPLAIELAAPRVRLLPPTALLAQLEQRLPVLTGSGSGLPARQQSLRNTIGWSYDLLAPVEQALLRRLSVFAGRWTIDAAARVALGDGASAADVLDGLTTLAEHNLIFSATEGDGEPRLAMLETIREFARDLLARSGEEPEVRRDHAEYMRAFAETEGDAVHRADHVRCLQRALLNIDDLRAALAWRREQADAPSMIHMIGSLGIFWYLVGLTAEGDRWMQSALAIEGVSLTPAERGAARYINGLAAWDRRDLPAARAALEECIAQFRASGDTIRRLHALTWLAETLAGLGEAEAGERAHAEALALAEEIGDPYLRAMTLVSLGDALHNRGDLSAARSRYEESLTLSGAFPERGDAAYAIRNLGHIARDTGDRARARVLFCESLRLNLDDRDGRAVAACLVALAGLRLRDDAPGDAARLIAAAEAHLDALGIESLLPMDRRYHDRNLALLHQALDAEVAERYRSEGRALSLDAAVAEALAEPPLNTEDGPGRAAKAMTAGPGHAALSAREREVLRLLAAGRSNRDIAAALVISLNTVLRHVTHILEKTGAANRTEAAAYAHRHGLAG